MSCTITVSTKDPAEFYPDGLARSIHFSLSEDTNTIELNHGYGILFARGLIDDRDVIVPKACKAPKIWMEADGSYRIAAIRTKEDGSDEDSLAFVSWITTDFCDFQECAPVFVLPAYADAGTSASLSDQEASALLAYWNWTPGESRIAFPKARGFGDPVFFFREGSWYFLSTNDNVDDIGLYIRKADSIDALLETDENLHLILDKNEEKGFVQTFWAPEAHVIGGELYILFAISSQVWGPCCHSMKLKKGCDPIYASSWEEPRPMLRKDGTRLTIPTGALKEEQKKDLPKLKDRSLDNRFGISLDMTYFEAQGRSYMVWSYRTGLGSELDTGSMLMIGEIDPAAPDKLLGDPVLISRPLYGYENTSGTINNEGPFVYKKDGQIHIFYSGGDARGYLYIINTLTAPETADLLCGDTWKKGITPIGHFKTWPGKYGPGHNSWYRDENGKDWIAFHCVEAPGERIIAVAIEEMPPHF